MHLPFLPHGPASWLSPPWVLFFKSKWTLPQKGCSSSGWGTGPSPAHDTLHSKPTPLSTHCSSQRPGLSPSEPPPHPSLWGPFAHWAASCPPTSALYPQQLEQLVGTKHVGGQYLLNKLSTWAYDLNTTCNYIPQKVINLKCEIKTQRVCRDTTTTIWCTETLNVWTTQGYRN